VFNKRAEAWSQEDIYYQFNGNDGCRYLHATSLFLLKLAMLSVYSRFPDRAARKVNIGDCSRNDGVSCPLHPPGSHQHLNAVDLDYMVKHGSSNITQYRSQTFEPVVKIWNGDKLDKDMFDWERNFELWKAIYTAFPDCVGFTHTDIYYHILSKLNQDDAILFKKHIKPDSIADYHHDIHIHFTLYRPL